MTDWDITDLVEHLRGAGLSFRVVAAEQGKPGHRAYLTTTAATRRELDRLMKVPERLADWQGTVYCERHTHDEENLRVRRGLWGSGCLEAGPFLLFGDPDLLAEIRAALFG
jgi:hypothetical protein